MGYHPRIETPELASFTTVRSRNSELWLVNNSALEECILGYVAKFSERYAVELFGVAIEGNHLHTLAEYPNSNRAAFHRDLNSCVARAIPRYAATYPGGRFWARRFSSEFAPGDADIENWFFYLVLQPVQDGLVDRISDYPGYNCFNDAVNGVERSYQVINWAAYNSARRYNSKLRIQDFTYEVKLRFKRLPGYEELSRSEYRAIMLKKLEERRVAAIAKRNRLAAGRDLILLTKPGSRPRNTKTSDRDSHRPRILSVCPERKAYYYRWYFDILGKYREASAAYRSGELDVEFPPGTYRPNLLTAPPLKRAA